MRVMDTLRAFLQAALDRNEVTVTEMASQAGCSREYVYKVLRGDSVPTIDLAERLAATAGVSFSLKKQKRKKLSA